MLSRNKYTSRSSLGSAIYRYQKKTIYLLFTNGLKKLQKCVSVKEEYFKGL